MIAHRRITVPVVLVLAVVVAVIAWPRGPSLLKLADGTLIVDHGHLASVDAGRAVPVNLVGINAYQLTSDWSVNEGCGYGGWSDQSMDAFFASIRPGSLVRTWFFQSMATDGGRRNWAALDRVVQDAAAHQVRLIAALANGNGGCDDGEWKAASWFAGGYRQPDGVQTYAGWVRSVVARYAPSGAVAMWEPVNEPNPVTCQAGGCSASSPCADEAAATADLVSFFTTIGGEIQALAPHALVADGSLGTGNCGTQTPADFDRVISTPTIDVVDYHDYSSPANTLPADLPRRISQAKRADKASLIEESGVTGCGTGEQRAATYARKITAAFSAGVSGYLPWWYGDNTDPQSCDGPIDKRSDTFLMLRYRTWPVSGRSA